MQAQLAGISIQLLTPNILGVLFHVDTIFVPRYSRLAHRKFRDVYETITDSQRLHAKVSIFYDCSRRQTAGSRLSNRSISRQGRALCLSNVRPVRHDKTHGHAEARNEPFWLDSIDGQLQQFSVIILSFLSTSKTID
jgi:hypothetical protein